MVRLLDLFFLFEIFIRYSIDHSINAIMNESSTFMEYMKNRRVPLEFKDKKKIIQKILEETFVGMYFFFFSDLLFKISIFFLIK